MGFCLIKQQAEKFKEMIISGKISPAILASMNSEKRGEFFKKEFGKDVGNKINGEIEAKLLLKNQARGIANALRGLLGIKKDIDKSMANRIAKLDKIFTEKEIVDFLSGLVSKKIGFSVSEVEYKKLAELAQDAQDKKTVALSKMKNGQWKSEDDKNKYGIDFGAAKVAFDNFYGKLEERARGGFVENIKEAEGVRKVIKTIAIESFRFIAENTRALVASFDNSFFGRQGRKAITRPDTFFLWLNNFGKSFVQAGKIIIGKKGTGKKIADAVKAEIYSRENYLNGNYLRGVKLALGIREEETPTSLPAKIPFLGRFFEASEVIYAAGAMRLRADIADMLYAKAEKEGKNLKDHTEIGAINDIINSMTGRANFLNASESWQHALNIAFFSPKFAWSNVQTLTRLFTAKTTFAKKQAAYNLIGLALSSALLMSLWKWLYPEETELDPRSSNFGKVKIGNQYVDITGGFGSFFVLGARVITLKSKNTFTGIITSKDDFGGRDGLQMVTDFIENKTSPIASLLKTIYLKEDFKGRKIGMNIESVGNLAFSGLVPIVLQQGIEKGVDIKNEGISTGADILTVLILDGLGFSVSDYIFQDNWNGSKSKELIEFKEEVGQEKFDEANRKYVTEVSKMYLKLPFDADFQSLDNEERKTELTKRKKEIKDEILVFY